MESRRSRPKPASEIIPALMQQVAKKHEALHRLQRRWGRLVGRPLARHTRPTGLRRNTLYVHADDPGATFLLSLEKQELLTKLKGEATPPIEEIVVRPGAG